MGHRFQAGHQTIETGQEGVFCGFMGNNIYPRSCIELWVWVILIDPRWQGETDFMQWISATAQCPLLLAIFGVDLFFFLSCQNVVER